MAPYVFKIKYGEVLRRVTVETSLLDNGPDMTFSQLEETIRQAFKISATSDLVVMYTDKDNDVVTMAGDLDLHDACVLQGLNPLRLTVVVQESQRSAHHGRHGRWGHGHGHGHGHGYGRSQPQPEAKISEMKNVADLKNLFGNTMKLSQDTAKQTLDYAQQVMQACEPLIKGAPSMVVSEVMESLMKLASSSQTGATGATSSQPGAAGAATSSQWTTSPQSSSSREEQPETCQVPPPVQCGPHFPQFPEFPPFPEFSPFPHFSAPFHCPAPEPPAPGPAPGPVGTSGGDKDQATPTPQDTKDAAQHRGVQCDVCGMVPIVGTRYKSNKKHDYDLCQTCFHKYGRSEDYTQIERPLWRPRFNPQFSGGRMMRCPAIPSYYGGGRPSFNMRGPHMHGSSHGPYAGKGDSRCGGAFGSAGGKLDARFVQDVTIFDGTEFAPGTAFTKIWRLRNSGSCAWPKSTQLIYVGGDELGSVLMVTVELPEQGLEPDGEVEVSVDLVAPEKPGRYVSHWRLVSPTGQKFGHRVWVLIQVVPKDEQSPQMMESLLASSQDDIEMREVADAGVQAQPMEDDDAGVQQQLVDPFPAADVDILEPEVVDILEPKEAEPEKVHYPEISMEALTVEPEVIDSEKAQQEENTAVESSELGNFSMVNMPSTLEIPVFAPEPEAAAAAAPSPQEKEQEQAPRVVIVEDESADNSGKEQTRAAADTMDSVDVMLGTLESMGFKQRDLNQELLMKNEFDLQHTLDDLVMAAEWDPMLEELEEMGFYDTDMNRRLMFKNNGSVKRVVKELVQMYKDPKGKEQI